MEWKEFLPHNMVVKDGMILCTTCGNAVESMEKGCVHIKEEHGVDIMSNNWHTVIMEDGSELIVTILENKVVPKVLPEIEKQVVTVNGNVGKDKLGGFILKMCDDLSIDVADVVVTMNTKGNFVVGYYGVISTTEPQRGESE